MKSERHVSIAVQRRGRLERFELPLGALRIGSASYCDVRLGPDEAAPEHVVFEPEGQRLRVRAVSREPEVTMDGLTLESAPIERRGVLRIGDVTISVEISEAKAIHDAAGQRLRKLKQFAALSAFGVLGYYALYAQRGESALQRSVPPTPLFDGQAEPACRHEDREAARTFAEEQQVAADSKRERSAFRLHDGVLAVPLYEQAAACFLKAGDEDAAEEATFAAAQLSERLETELHAHQVRLEFFLGRGRYGAAEREVAVLRRLLADRNDVYAQWLSAVARELRTALSQTKKG